MYDQSTRLPQRRRDTKHPSSGGLWQGEFLVATPMKLIANSFTAPRPRTTDRAWIKDEADPLLCDVPTSGSPCCHIQNRSPNALHERIAPSPSQVERFPASSRRSLWNILRRPHGARCLSGCGDGVSALGQFETICLPQQVSCGASYPLLDRRKSSEMRSRDRDLKALRGIAVECL